MKSKVLLTLFLGVGVLATSLAQKKIYGTLGLGSLDGRTGGYYSINVDGTGYKEQEYDPHPIDGNLPLGELLLAADGRLYGTTQNGGSSQAGVLFSFKTDGSDYKVHHQFGVTTGDGSLPTGKLVQLSTGELIGVTYVGGANNRGVLYKTKPDGSNYTVLLTFSDATSGANPGDGPILANDGKLYGTVQAGVNGGGGVYVINTDGTGFNLIKKFDAKGGASRAPLMQASDGMLYGTTYIDESSNPKEGSVFKMATDGTGFTVLHLFISTEGKNPQSGVIEAADGLLYGQCFGNIGGNVVYKLNKNGTGFAIVHSFSELNQQGVELTQTADGKLYGLTRSSMFRMNADGTSFENLKTLDATTGFQPYSALTIVGDKLFGTLGAGGAATFGGVFSYSNTDGYKRTFDFGPTYDNGIYPASGLTKSLGGKYFAISQAGGANGKGVLYRVDGALNITKLLDLPAITTDGIYDGNVVELNNTLFGVCKPGYSDNGFIFSVNEDGTQFKKIFTFDDTNGASPNPLVAGTDGSIYGSTYLGGSNGEGVVFKIKPDGSEYTVLRHFKQDSNGGRPQGELTLSSDGFLYGGTEFYGANDYGTMFRMKTDGTSFSVVYQFTDNLFDVEYAMKEVNGMFYGVTSAGGMDGYGTIFKMKTDGTGFAPIFSFVENSGGIPTGGVVVDSGNIYATSSYGAKYDHGALFTIKVDGTGFKVLYDFTTGTPQYDLLIDAPPVEIITQKQTISFDPIPDRLTGDDPFHIVATASSGLPVSFTIDKTDVATINGNTVTIKGAGTANITATQAGSTSYEAAPPVVRQLVVKLITAIADLNDNSLRVYPNPVGDMLYIQLDGVAKPQVITTSGSVISPNTESLVGNLYRVDMTSMSPGIYFIKAGGQAVRVVKQ